MEGKYGHLTIIEATKERKNSYVVYKCKCDCGNITYRTKSSLTSSIKASKNGGPYCDECAKDACLAPQVEELRPVIGSPLM